MANREEILKQSLRFRHTLDAIEHVIQIGNAEALEDLIREASEGARRLADERVDAAARIADRPAARGRLALRMYDIPFLDLPPLIAASRHGAPAGLEEHLQPRAAARRLAPRHDRGRTTCSTPTTRA